MLLANCTGTAPLASVEGFPQDVYVQRYARSNRLLYIQITRFKMKQSS